MRTVFSIDGEFWAVNWGSGLTEYQEDEFWDSQPYRVKKQEKNITATEYIPID